MKKILLVLFTNIYVVFPLYSQTNIGFKAAANLSTVIGEDATVGNEDPDSLTVGMTDMIPMLVNAIKELSAKVTALEAA